MSRILPRFDFRIEFAASTDVGLVRQSNEDRLLCCPELALFAIADGMGGHAAGEVAAQIAVDTVRDEVLRPPAAAILDAYVADPNIEARREVFALLRRVTEAAHAAILEARRKEPSYQGMGTTLDFVVLAHSRAFFAHAGDSRAYLVRPTTTVQLTQDHALYDTLRAAGNAIARKPQRNPLVNAIGLAGTVSVDTLFVDLSRGDRILLCTDGIHNAIESEASLSRFCAKGSPEEVAEGLLKHARERGGRDNASVIVIDIKERFVKRADDAGPSSRELSVLSACPLLSGMSPAAVLGALAAGVEVELAAGDRIPRDVASDLVAYVVLDGAVDLPDGRRIVSSGLLYPESLVGARRKGDLPVAVSRTRLIRIRKDDFAEVCEHDAELGAALYQRLARYLALGTG
ncbi:protein phosphatase 2C domain-containing protein [Sorangium cellulosum]|uniref:protein phosphatase 2C domain-containing protein n=1 Tax=Sorangium cellulosum TaxID=56 RepID=UPI001F3EFD9E|nr:protein phosphatase 2C domain-containing protein [Sorangium cellulosum]